MESSILDVAAVVDPPLRTREVRNMLKDEYNVCAADEEDVGDARNNTMKIKLIDDIPCQATYNSISQPLYQELKHYIGDLCDALRHFVSFVQFKKREKHPWRRVTFSKFLVSGSSEKKRWFTSFALRL